MAAVWATARPAVPPSMRGWQASTTRIIDGAMRGPSIRPASGGRIGLLYSWWIVSEGTGFLPRAEFFTPSLVPLTPGPLGPIFRRHAEMARPTSRPQVMLPESGLTHLMPG